MSTSKGKVTLEQSLRRSARDFGWCLALAILVSTGCSGPSLSTKDVPASPSEGFPNHSISEILGQLPDMPMAMDRVAFEMQLAVSSPEQSGRFTTTVQAKVPDSLLASIRFPLGIEGARILVTPDSAFVYDRLKKVVFRSTVETMASIMPGDLIGPAMVQQVTGFIRPSPGIQWEKSVGDNTYFLHSPDSLLRYTINPATWRVEQIQTRNEQGEVIEQRWYLDFKEMSGVLLPVRSILSRPTEDTRVSAVLRRFTHSVISLDLDLDAKEDAQWVDIIE